jgi:hypothetical protein
MSNQADLLLRAANEIDRLGGHVHDLDGHGGEPETCRWNQSGAVSAELRRAAEQPTYVPALIHGRKSTLWVHGCGHVETWPTDPKYPPIEGEGCDACEGAPDGTWRQLYVGVITSA